MRVQFEYSTHECEMKKKTDDRDKNIKSAN